MDEASLIHIHTLSPCLEMLRFFLLFLVLRSVQGSVFVYMSLLGLENTAKKPFSMGYYSNIYEIELLPMLVLLCIRKHITHTTE